MNQSPTSNPQHNQGIRVEILIAKNCMWIFNCKFGHLKKGIVNLLGIFSAYCNSEVLSETEVESLLLHWKKEQVKLTLQKHQYKSNHPLLSPVTSNQASDQRETFFSTFMLLKIVWEEPKAL